MDLCVGFSEQQRFLKKYKSVYAAAPDSNGGSLAAWIAILV